MRSFIPIALFFADKDIKQYSWYSGGYIEMQKILSCLLDLAHYKYGSHSICEDPSDHIALNLYSWIKNRYKKFLKLKSQSSPRLYCIIELPGQFPQLRLWGQIWTFKAQRERGRFDTSRKKKLIQQWSTNTARFKNDLQRKCHKINA